MFVSSFFLFTWPISFIKELGGRKLSDLNLGILSVILHAEFSTLLVLQHHRDVMSILFIHFIHLVRLFLTVTAKVERNKIFCFEHESGVKLKEEQLNSTG